MKHIPLLLTALRVVLAPVVVALVLWWPADSGLSTLLGICLVLAFLSDYFDGVIARRLGVATPSLRRLDSIADTMFYVAATFAAWRLHPEAITSRAGPLLALLALELVRYAFDWLKFRREASYHMWSSKAWGLALFIGFFSLLALDVDTWPVDLAVYLGIAADIEGLLISAVLPRWQSDVPSIVHAWALRGQASNEPEA